MEKLHLFFLFFLTMITAANTMGQIDSFPLTSDDQRRKLSLTEATKRLKVLHTILQNEAASPKALQSLTGLYTNSVPEKIETFPHVLAGSGSQIKMTDGGTVVDYAQSFMNVTSMFLSLQNIPFWKRAVQNENAELTPESLLRDVDKVVDFSVKNLPLVDVRGGHTVEALSYKSIELEIELSTVAFSDDVVDLENDNLFPKKFKKRDLDSILSRQETTYTVVSVFYPTLPNLIKQGLNPATEVKSSKSAANQSFCGNYGFKVTNSLCSLAKKLSFQQSPESNSAPSALAWSFPLKSSVRSITAYHQNSDGFRKAISVPVKFKIESNSEKPIIEDENIKISNPITHKCVFYNTTLSKWSDEGCKLISKDSESYSCFCNHTTNFAILVLVDIFPSNDKNLESCSFASKIISYCAGTLSIACLLASIAFFASSRKVSQRIAERNTVHLCLAMSMMLLNVVLLVDDLFTYTFSQGGNTKPVWLCSIIAFLTHFFLLCNFSWMTIEGALLYRFVIDGNLRNRSFGKLKYLIGWIVPFCISGVTFIAGTLREGNYLQTSYYETSEDLSEEASEFVCYLSRDLVWAAFVPMLISVISNITITILVARVIGRLTRENTTFKPSTVSVNSTRTNIKIMKKSLAAFCKLYPTLGILWMISVVVVLLQNKTMFCLFQILHVCLNGTQGVFLFFITILQSKENRSVLKSGTKSLRRNAHTLIDYFRTRSNLSVNFSSAENRTSATDLRLP